MKNLKNIVLTIGLIFIFQLNGFTRSVIVRVNEIFKSSTEISEIKVISYESDSIMYYVNLKTNDTLSYYFAYIKLPKYENNQKKWNWRGTFPEIGEIVIFVQFKWDGKRIIFGRKKMNNYKFWDPRDILFANVIFLIPKSGIFTQTEFCKKHPSKTYLSISCSEGFLVKITDFNKLKLSLNKKQQK